MSEMTGRRDFHLTTDKCRVKVHRLCDPPSRTFGVGREAGVGTEGRCGDGRVSEKGRRRVPETTGIPREYRK